MSLDDAIALVAGVRPLLVASDFDGTLAPLVTDPDLARGHPDAMKALATLATAPGVTVAIVSGRRHSDLVRLTGSPDGVMLIGEHGNDYGKGPVGSEGLVGALAEELSGFAARLPGAWVEQKGLSVGFHYRMADAADAEAIADEVRSWARTRELHVSDAKKLIELSVANRTKGDAIVELAADIGAERIVFVGDDTTDETVFQTLGTQDVGVKVGTGESAATYRVEGPEAVAGLLRRLAELAV